MATVLTAIRAKYPAHGSFADSLANLAALKQTHELTLEVIKFLDAAASAGMPGGEMLELFDGFVKPYASKMSPLNLVKILGRCVSASDVTSSVALELISRHQALLSKSKDAHILSQVLIADIHIKKEKNLGEARTVIDAVSDLLRDPMYAQTVSGSARGSYHLAASELYMSLNNDLEFFQHVLKFLTYTPVGEIPAETLARTTKQAAVIALIHPEINDFGELISLPALGTVGGWTLDFLQAIHRGDFEAFDKAIKTHSTYLQTYEGALLAKIDTSLRRKLTMISLAELAGFVAPEKNRRLTFAQISAHCRVPLTDVEELVMATMGSGNLISGVIDQVQQTVVVTAVAPRVLNRDRILILKSRIESWTLRTQSLVTNLTDLTPELLIS